MEPRSQLHREVNRERQCGDCRAGMRRDGGPQGVAGAGLVISKPFLKAIPESVQFCHSRGVPTATAIYKVDSTSHVS